MKVLITGIAGQDGFYLAIECASKGWEVVGTKMESEIADSKLESLGIRIINLDLSNADGISKVISMYKPDTIFHLAGLSSVGESWKFPIDYLAINGLGGINLLEAAKKYTPSAKIVLAGSAEMFDNTSHLPWNSKTKILPRNPYALSKYVVCQYGELLKAQGFWISTAFLFNHESPKRNELFVSRKITMAVAKISSGTQNSLALGDVSISRDWGYAPEFMSALTRIIQLDDPSNISLGTGVLTSIREFIQHCFTVVGIQDWQRYLSLDQSSVRSNDTVGYFCDTSEAEDLIGWKSQTSVSQIAEIMVKHDLDLINAGGK